MEDRRACFRGKTGTRLLTILERLFRDLKFELPSTDIDKLEVTEACVDNPEAELNKILGK
jgi:ATP-dependent protease Clp ATPase subunit